MPERNYYIVEDQSASGGQTAQERFDAMTKDPNAFYRVGNNLYLGSILQHNIATAYTKGEVDSAISAALSSAYKPKGNATYETLPTLTAANLGNIYNMTADFTTDSNFVEGAGITVKAGSEVGVIDVGTASTPSYKFTVLGGFVDLSNYVQKSNTAGLIKNDGTIDSTAYAAKVSGATSGDLASLDSNGGLTDSGKKLSDLSVHGPDLYDNNAEPIISWVSNGFTGGAANRSVWGTCLISGLSGIYYLYANESKYCSGQIITTDGRVYSLSFSSTVCTLTYKPTINATYFYQNATITEIPFKKDVLGNDKVATVETSTTASKAYAVGDLFIYGGQLYKVTTAIASGGTIVMYGSNKNVEQTTLDQNLGGGDPTFVGTQAEWTAEQHKEDYLYVNITDDSVGVTPVDSVTDGNMNPVTSNAVYDALGESSWKGTATQWTNLPSTTKAKYDGKPVYITDDAGTYTGMPLPVKFASVTGSGSTVSKSISNAAITSDMYVINQIISNPAAVRSDLTITTSSGSITLSGTISGTTDITVFLQSCRTMITG